MPLLLASTSPQRRAILEQLAIPFDVIAPAYPERAPESVTPAGTVRANALGKARSVASLAAGRPVLGVDTEVALGARILGKPASPAAAASMLAALAGRAHEVVSGLCLLGDGFEDAAHDTTRVVFRDLSRHEIERYVATGEWEGRAGGYAIQERGAGLVERIEGDYLNVVGLPAAVLVRILAKRFPGVYGIG